MGGSSSNDGGASGSTSSSQAGMTGSERTADSEANASRDRPDDNDRGGAREAKEAFDRAMDNANRPDRAPASPPETTTGANDDDRGKTDKPDDLPDRAAGPPGIGAPPSSPSPTDTAKETDDNDDQDERGFLDRMQDFAKENPRVDSYGNPRGVIDANGVQHGDVASGLMSSGTSADDLARQLGFLSPGEMTASQTTSFIEEKYQEQKTAEMVAAMEERYGPVPQNVQARLANGQITIVPASLNNAKTPDEMSAYAASIAFGDIEYTINNINVIGVAETKLNQGDVDGYYREIDKIDPYGDLALDVRQQFSPSGVIAADYYRDTLRKEGFTDKQIDDFWADDTKALARADLASRKAELGEYGLGTGNVLAFDGILGEDDIAKYHERAMGTRYDNWTGKIPHETLDRWMATTPAARVALANDMVASARSGNSAAQAWVDEVIGDWNTIGSMIMSPREVLSTLPDSAGLVGPALGGIIRNQWDVFFGDDPEPKGAASEQ